MGREEAMEILHRFSFLLRRVGRKREGRHAYTKTRIPLELFKQILKSPHREGGNDEDNFCVAPLAYLFNQLFLSVLRRRNQEELIISRLNPLSENRIQNFRGLLFDIAQDPKRLGQCVFDG